MSSQSGRTSALSRPGLRRLWLLLALFVLPFMLRAHAVDHGLPRGYVPDTHIVRNALGMAKTKNPVPRAGEFSNYPNLLPYMLLPLYGALYAQGRASGEWGGTQEFADHVLLNPAGVHLLARWLILMFGVMTPWVVWRIGRALGLEQGALVAAVLVGVSVLHVQLSTHERPWVPMTFFIALSAWAAVLHTRDGGARVLFLSGLAGGLAFACHPGGLPSLGLAGLAWLLGPRGWRGANLRERLRTGVLTVGLFLLVAVVLGYPHWIVHGRTAADAVIGGEAADVHLGGMSAVLRLRWETFERLSRALVGYEPILVLLGLPGLLLAFRRRPSAVLAVWTLIWSGFFMTNWSDHVRYLLPTAVMLALPAGALAQRLMRTTLGRAALLMLLAVALVQGARLSWILAREDTRFEAERLLSALPEGARVGLDRYGPDVELSLAALKDLNGLREQRGQALRMRESRRGALLLEGHPGLAAGVDALPLGDLFEVDVRAGSCTPWPELEGLGADPATLLAALNVTHLMLVERRPSDPGANPLSALVEGREPLWILDPTVREGGTQNGSSEAWLPTEMDFPLTGLWRVVRPGPRLSLYDLR